MRSGSRPEHPRPRVLVTAVLLALVAIGLAGCASEERYDAEIRSDDAFDPQAAADAAASQGPPPGEGRGGLAGVVVDEAIRPIAGASVRLPTMDAAETTRRDGTFRFDGLPPGPYLLHADAPGHDGAQALVEVEAGEVTRVRILLIAQASNEPYQVTQAFEGFAEVTDAGWAGFLLYGYALVCSACQFDLELQRDGLHTVVTEAVMAPGPSDSGFEVYMTGRGDSTDRQQYALGGNPFRFELLNETLGGTERFDLAISPWSFPAPETEKRFQVFVTAFYHAPPPPDWSILQEGT